MCSCFISHKTKAGIVTVVLADKMPVRILPASEYPFYGMSKLVREVPEPVMVKPEAEFLFPPITMFASAV